MCERLLGRDVLELGARAAAERAARAGEHERVDLLRLASLEALEERRVLAVDRQDPAAAPLARGERELSGGDEALLVREREVDAVLERPERRVDSGEADDGVEDDVGLRALEQLGQVAADLLQRRVDVVERRRAGRRGAELELRMRLDDLDRLAADRSRGAEQRDALHPRKCRESGTPALVEAVGDDEEVRSRRREEQPVDPVEHAAVPAEKPSRVLHLEVALQRRLEQVADHLREHERRARARSPARRSGTCRACRRAR